jgi:hypothetical protein
MKRNKSPPTNRQTTTYSNKTDQKEAWKPSNAGMIAAS